MSASQHEPPGRVGSRRPGAMTMAMQAVQTRPSGPKVLRIGLIQAGKIVEERIIRQRETVTVGSSEKNHFTLTADQVGPRFELFQLVGGDYILNFTPSMSGRVGLPGGVQEFHELRSSGAARNAGNYHQVKLNDTSRGKVVVGDVTLLFQFVAPPPVQPRPQLPAAVVGGFIAGIDWLFTAFVMFSFMAHFGFIIYLENADWPVEPQLGTIPDSVADLIFQPPPEPEEPPETEETGEEDPEEEGEEPEEVAEVEQPRERSQQSAEQVAERRAQAEATARRAAADARARVEQLLVTGLGGEGSNMANVLQAGAVVGSQEEVLAQADGTAIATSSQAQLRERGGGGRLGNQTGNIGNLRGSDRATQQQSEGQAVQERRVRGSARLGGLTEERGSGDFDPSVAARILGARRRAVQACYERELRNNPSLSGRVEVTFTIQTTGSVSAASASQNTTGSASLGSCVAGVIRRVRFRPAPEGGSVTLAFPYVFAPQG